MISKKLLALTVLLATTTLSPIAVKATPIDPWFDWQIWVFVESYREKNNGDVAVTFEDSAGNQITNFPDSNGVNKCPNDPNMVIDKDHPSFDRLSKALLSAGLARKKVKIAYQGVNGTCYAKQVHIAM